MTRSPERTTERQHSKESGMKIIFEVTGLSCDLALHPISPQTAEDMREKAAAFMGNAT